ncbi:MAG: hypothetical protein FWG80_00030 [Alphaproteobacteria bacterium]|nr:hypothetical protein [Alphaproteobacteria bacterium]
MFLDRSDVTPLDLTDASISSKLDLVAGAVKNESSLDESDSGKRCGFATLADVAVRATTVRPELSESLDFAHKSIFGRSGNKTSLDIERGWAGVAGRADLSVPCTGAGALFLSIGGSPNKALADTARPSTLTEGKEVAANADPPNTAENSDTPHKILFLETTKSFPLLQWYKKMR